MLTLLNTVQTTRFGIKYKEIPVSVAAEHIFLGSRKAVLDANIRCRPGAVSVFTFISARKNSSGVKGRKSPADSKIVVCVIFFGIYDKY
jgi:hypothetical protein